MSRQLHFFHSMFYLSMNLMADVPAPFWQRNVCACPDDLNEAIQKQRLLHLVDHENLQFVCATCFRVLIPSLPHQQSMLFLYNKPDINWIPVFVRPLKNITNRQAQSFHLLVEGEQPIKILLV